jgi:hypothetical protein
MDKLHGWVGGWISCMGGGWMDKLHGDPWMDGWISCVGG